MCANQCLLLLLRSVDFVFFFLFLHCVATLESFSLFTPKCMARFFFRHLKLLTSHFLCSADSFVIYIIPNLYRIIKIAFISSFVANDYEFEFLIQFEYIFVCFLLSRSVSIRCVCADENKANEKKWIFCNKNVRDSLMDGLSQEPQQ